MKQISALIEKISAVFALLGAIGCAAGGVYLLWAGAERHLDVLIIAVLLFFMAAMEVVVTRSLWRGER
ncbi:hypothetical protein B1757_02530 [Acidithiobacillus marinus]|uniref:Uncharacterized protein n=1 Tax=Acidithiobacillus marinus TaxID=187490 RepID=A0A2I1DPP2_9PROT|nr:hypothetical protein [Acidithiobacillus marinus]PKY11855.1 hypothetical protein B1757_02530 [Acidithiobacillus marinus]